MLGVNFSWKEVVHMSPEMLGAYVLVGGVGLVCIGAGYLEKRISGGRLGYISGAVNGLLNLALPVSYVFMLLRFFSGF
ncbi:hypothetical protein ABES25_10045 [Bacillus gobiensis]|uniref:hypothetical protein n=1 Tax=Bacillus gobiensis TaxID=1441095 RepID=UPI003D1C6BB8